MIGQSDDFGWLYNTRYKIAQKKCTLLRFTSRYNIVTDTWYQFQVALVSFFGLSTVDFAAPPNVNLFALAQTTTDSCSSKPDTSSNSSLGGLCCVYGLSHAIYFLPCKQHICPAE